MKNIKPEIEWDESKAEDNHFLIQYYESRIKYWKLKYGNIGKKVISHYEKGVKTLKKEINN